MLTGTDGHTAASTATLPELIRSDFRRQAEMFGWKRVPVSESFWLTVDFRVRHRIGSISSRPLSSILIAIQYPVHKVIKAINHSSIGRDAEIGPGLLLAHFGGIWIHPGVKIGSDCTILQQVTIAGRSSRTREVAGFPKIGDRVTISPGAKILGGITIGDDAVVGANAVVLEDVPPGATVVGNPGRVIGANPTPGPGADTGHS